MIELPEHVIPACMAEGGAETAILDILLDHGLLIFSREDIYQNKVLPRVGGREFADRYLRYGLSKPLFLFRVIDSKAENFRLPSRKSKCSSLSAKENIRNTNDTATAGDPTTDPVISAWKSSECRM